MMRGWKILHLERPSIPGEVRGSPAHTLWSHKYTQEQFLITFSTQSHPRTQNWSHTRTQASSQGRMYTQKERVTVGGGVGRGGVGDENVRWHSFTGAAGVGWGGGVRASAGAAWGGG